MGPVGPVGSVVHWLSGPLGSVVPLVHWAQWSIGPVGPVVQWVQWCFWSGPKSGVSGPVLKVVFLVVFSGLFVSAVTVF